MSTNRNELRKSLAATKKKVDKETKLTSSVIKSTELSRKRSLERLGSKEREVKIAESAISELKTKLALKGIKE